MKRNDHTFICCTQCNQTVKAERLKNDCILMVMQTQVAHIEIALLLYTLCAHDEYTVKERDRIFHAMP